MQQIVKKLEVSHMTKEQLISNDTFAAWGDMNDIECANNKISIKNRAKELGCLSDVKDLISAWEKEYSRIRKLNKASRIVPGTNVELMLETDEKGKSLQTINNFLMAMDNDKYFSGLRFNEFSYAPEIIRNGKTEKWIDADDSLARHYLEKTYGLYSLQKYDDAIRIKFKKTTYNPIKDIIEPHKWDGVERISGFLHKWIKCADNGYTREVSRLIFAGGIHRLYNPGCKFDDMAVLIGTKQGEGKSTFVRWLAMKDEYFREVDEIEGQKGIESLEGGWICEMSELLALTKSKEIESVKSFLTRVKDNYRRPFDRRVTEHLRRCIFIGTTNKSEFLTDKTGNRRFYPVIVSQSGYDLFDREKEIKDDILNCWVEAKHKFDKGEMKPYADRALQTEIKYHQNSSVEEDWRVELILSYIENMNDVCTLQVWKEALGMEYAKPSKKDSGEMRMILESTGLWKRADGRKYFDGIGQQRYFSRVVRLTEQDKNDTSNYDTVPF